MHCGGSFNGTNTRKRSACPHERCVTAAFNSILTKVTSAPQPMLPFLVGTALVGSFVFATGSFVVPGVPFQEQILGVVPFRIS